MSTIFTPPRFTPVSGNGTTYPAATLTFSITGTTTPKNTYSNADLLIGNVNANPVVADANGLFGPIYLTSGDYKVILKDADGNTIWTVDPVSGLGAGDTLSARGDLLTRDASGYKRLAIGAATYVLTSDGVDVGWAAPIIPRGSIQGLTYANNSGDATNDIDIAVGSAMDSTNTRMMILAAALTKKLDVAWAVGNDQGGILSGSAADVDYNIWLIQRSDNGVTDIGFETTANATPTLPTDYNFYRKIGWFKRASSTIVPFTTYETAGGGIALEWKIPRLDINLANTLTTTRRTDALTSTPQTFSVVANLNVSVRNSITPFYMWIYCPDQTDSAPSDTAAPLANMNYPTDQHHVNQVTVRTSATGTIAARASAANIVLYAVAVVGFEWSRR